MPKRQILKYPEESLVNALKAVKNGMKIRAASKKYGVPRTTLQDRVHNRVLEGPRRMGPDSILSQEEEEAISIWCNI